MAHEPLHDANEVVDDFASQLADLAGANDAKLTRIQEGSSDRSFLIELSTARVGFVAKLSQSERGFWGLGIEKASEMIECAEHLVLLTAADEGYFVSSTRLKHLTPQLSHSGRDYKIGESRIKKEPRFRSLEELWDILRERLAKASTATVVRG